MQRFRTNCTSDYINRLASIYLIPFYLFIAQPIEGRGVLHPPALSRLGHLPAGTESCCVPWNPTCPLTTELPWGSDTPCVLCHRIAVSHGTGCSHRAAVGPLMSPVLAACARVFLSPWCVLGGERCPCVHTHLNMHASTPTCAHTCTRTGMCTCPHGYTCTSIHMCKCIRAQTPPCLHTSTMQAAAALPAPVPRPRR